MKSSVTSNSGTLWSRLAWLCAQAGAALPIRAVVLGAHPDDETIGASAIVGRIGDCIAVSLTDGAPRDRRFWPTLPIDARPDYARVRRDEMCAALSLAGVPPDRILCLGGVDQESLRQLPLLIERFTALLRQWKPNAVITHPYEGGHPDHDSAALVASAAIGLLRDAGAPPPELLEMTSYHNRSGQCAKGEFLPFAPVRYRQSEWRQVEIVLSPAERQRKQQMFACYASQQEVLRYFAFDPERLRPAPHYDFSQPPHPGKLWYEMLNWPVTGAEWRSSAVAALSPGKKLVCA